MKYQNIPITIECEKSFVNATLILESTHNYEVVISNFETGNPVWKTITTDFSVVEYLESKIYNNFFYSLYWKEI